MSLTIHVTAYSGHKANERPRDFTVDEDLYAIAEVEDRWYEPEGCTSEFVQRKASGTSFAITNRKKNGRCRAGSMAMSCWARPSIQLVTVDADVHPSAEKEIESCERRHPDDAEIPFD